MRLSEEIFNKKDFPTVKGSLLNGVVGYNQHAVEIFLETIMVKAEKLEAENERYQEQIRQLKEERDYQGMNGTPATQPVEMDDAESEEIRSMKDEIKKKLKQIETLERSYKRMIYIAEQEAEEIKDEAREEAKRILQNSQEKAESLIREANNRFSEREREIHALNSKAEELRERLKTVAQFIEEAVS